jgi:hypothetical protein
MDACPEALRHGSSIFLFTMGLIYVLAILIGVLFSFATNDDVVLFNVSLTRSIPLSAVIVSACTNLVPFMAKNVVRAVRAPVVASVRACPALAMVASRACGHSNRYRYRSDIVIAVDIGSSVLAHAERWHNVAPAGAFLSPP